MILQKLKLRIFVLTLIIQKYFTLNETNVLLLIQFVIVIPL